MIGIVGMGFMGRTHAAAYESARRAGYPVAIQGIFSTGGPPPSAWRSYDSLDRLLADPAIRAVSVCTYTDTHVPIALRAIEAGKHVLVEKPVALDAAAIQSLGAAASRRGLVALPGLCMRFWPGWPWLRDRIRSGSFGAVRSAHFTRTGAKPAWSSFYDDDRRSGNALFDLHLHDADFVRWTFGDPVELRSVGSPRHLTTTYRFPGARPEPVAEGGWLADPAAPFTMRYAITFEDATVDFELGRADLVRLTRRGRTEAVPVPTETAYELQARHFLDLILGRVSEPVATLADAARVTELLLAERQSLERGAAVRLGVAGE